MRPAANAPETPKKVVCNSAAARRPDIAADAARSPLRDGLAKCAGAAERVAYVTAHAAEFAAEQKSL